MLITYFDEVKYHKGKQNFYWLAGITVDALAVWKMEKQVNDLAQEVFGSSKLTKGTEFHASVILGGREHFKGWGWPLRIELIKRLITILGSYVETDIGKIHVKLDPSLMTLEPDFEKVAFMFFVERVQMHLKEKNQPGILIGDRESDLLSGKYSEHLSGFRASKTKYAYGKELENLIDTVHFTHSHHSRMIQLADLYVWLLQFNWTAQKDSWHKQQILDHARTTHILSPTYYKHWPTQQSNYLPIDPAKVFGGQPPFVPPPPV